MLGLMIRKYGAATEVSEGYWFAQKLYGYGAVPVTVQGWAATFAYLALIGLVVLSIPSTEGKIAIGLVVTAGYLILTWKKTEGGWRWRWGRGSD